LTYLLDETHLPWKLQRSHIPAQVVRWYHLTVPGEKVVDCLLGCRFNPGPRPARAPFSKDAILFDKVFDEMLLILIHRAGDTDDKK
jgi:hypothetical protein